MNNNSKPYKYILIFLIIIINKSSFSTNWLEMQIAQIQSLDKITARINTHEINIGEELKIGTLIVKMKSCQTRPPFLPPESATFIQVYDLMSKKNNSNLIFSGWMFASSPALSSLEHAIYDISLISCKNLIKNSKSESFSELIAEN
tara:strand:- start:52 stop:489 length:438 start_codon:yes stop_codon:yes gene_type:complete